MKIETSFVYPPIPIRDFDWQAVDSDTYDGAEGSHCPIGHGATELAAIHDLINQIEENGGPSMDNVSNREPMLSHLKFTHPQKFAVGDSVKTLRGVIGRPFSGTVTEIVWLAGGWVYTVDDGTNLVGGLQYRAEEQLERRHTDAV